MISSQHHRVIWRSRRGLLELDLLLYPFAQACFATLAEEDQVLYQELLECEDVDILDWLKDDTVCPEKWQSLCEQIRSYASSTRN